MPNPAPRAPHKSPEAGVMTKQDWYARLASCPLVGLLDHVLHQGTTVDKLRQQGSRRHG